MSFGIKATQLLLITLICVFIFALVYNKIYKRDLADAFYISMLNQSMVGSASSQLPDDSEKLVIGFQCVLAFLISSGMVILYIS